MKKNCYKWLGEQCQSNSQPKNMGNETLITVSRDVAGEVAYCTTQDETCLHVSGEDAEWVVDTAASHHVTPYRNSFTTYKAGDFGSVKMGNSSSSEIVGIGDIHVKTCTGSIITLKDVRHVPDLRLNLLSVGALDKEGYKTRFNGGTWKLSKGVLIITRGHACGTLYKTQLKICTDSLAIAEEASLKNVGAQVSDVAPGLFMSNNDEETEENAEQGEPQPTSPDASPSQEIDDGNSSQMVQAVRRSERGLLLTEDGEPESFQGEHKNMPHVQGRDRGDVSGAVFFSSWKSDRRYGMRKIRHVHKVGDTRKDRAMQRHSRDAWPEYAWKGRIVEFPAIIQPTFTYHLHLPSSPTMHQPKEASS